jgi:hypothetical protein
MPSASARSDCRSAEAALAARRASSAVMNLSNSRPISSVRTLPSNWATALLATAGLSRAILTMGSEKSSMYSRIAVVICRARRSC